MKWIAWAFTLLLTNFFGTLTSRARNTNSIKYHGTVAALNHGTWLIAQTFLVTSIVRSGGLDQFVVMLVFYTSVSTLASILAHVVSLKYLERGNRRIGSYGDHP